MAVKLKFVEEVPTAKRGGGATGSRTMTTEVVEGLKEQPGRWAQLEGVQSPQTVAKFVADNGGTDGPWEYKSRNTGKTRKTNKGTDVAVYDVYVRYNPDGKKS